jgi:hypothetical protein
MEKNRMTPSNSPEHSFLTRDCATRGFIIGQGEDPYLGEGWHAREIHGPTGLPHRAVSEQATFRLRVSPDAPYLRLLLSASVSLLGKPYTGTLFVGEYPISPVRIDTEGWAIRVFDLSNVVETRDIEFALRSETTFVPAQIQGGSSDFRRIGCTIAAAILASYPMPKSTDLSCRGVVVPVRSYVR